MRRSILLVLVAALMLTATVGATASVAAGPGVEAQAAARARGRARRRAARCPRGRRARGRRAARCRARRPAARRRAAPAAGLADGFYQDAAKGISLTVTGGNVRVGLLLPAKCGARLAVTVPGTIRTSGSRTTGSGQIGSMTIQVIWRIAITHPSLAYQLEASSVVKFPDTIPCSDVERFSGRLTKR